MPARFVILHHTGYGCEHWDLMIEQGDALLTWQLRTEPTGLASFPISARRIGNHRKHYLEYEGEVGGGRGTVRRIDAGPAEIQKLTDTTCQFQAGGVRLSGSLTLERQEPPEWVLAVSEDAGQ